MTLQMHKKQTMCRDKVQASIDQRRAALSAYLDIMLLKAMTQMSEAILQAACMHRQGYPVRVLCPMVQPVDTAVICMAQNSFLCYLSQTTRKFDSKKTACRW